MLLAQDVVKTDISVETPMQSHESSKRDDGSVKVRVIGHKSKIVAWEHANTCSTILSETLSEGSETF